LKKPQTKRCSSEEFWAFALALKVNKLLREAVNPFAQQASLGTMVNYPLKRGALCEGEASKAKSSAKK